MSKRRASGSVFSHIMSTMYNTCIRPLPLFAPCASFEKPGDRSVKHGETKTWTAPHPLSCGAADTPCRGNGHREVTCRRLLGNHVCTFLVAMAWCLHRFTLRLRKPFHFFLCHHKVGGGAFCRLLLVRLVKHGHLARVVFLESDNLQDLSLLFGIVGEKTETLVVLCTREIFLRPTSTLS